MRIRGHRIPAAAGLAALALLSACEGPTHYEATYYADGNYPSYPEANSTQTVEWREILVWGRDPSRKEAVGFIETREVTLQGKIDPVTQYLVYDRNARAPFGHISDVGVTHLWMHGGARGEGYWKRIGEYSLDQAVRVLFRRPAQTNVGFEALEYAPKLD